MSVAFSPMATISLQVRKNGSEFIRFQAQCPAHLAKSSDYQGIDQTGLLFRCKETDSHMSHLFHAKAPRDIPHTPDQVKLWMDAHRTARISSKEVRKRGA